MKKNRHRRESMQKTLISDRTHLSGGKKPGQGRAIENLRYHRGIMMRLVKHARTPAVAGKQQCPGNGMCQLLLSPLQQGLHLLAGRGRIPEMELDGLSRTRDVSHHCLLYTSDAADE